MARAKTGWQCTECGWQSNRWVGRCGECQAWGSITEVGAARLRHVASVAPLARAVPISAVSVDEAQRTQTGIGELDRVLGDGLVPGAVVLLAGEPGVGKSTLLLEVAARWARKGRSTLYVTGEESAAQVRLRAGRTNAVVENLFLAAETDLGTILGHVEQVDPSLLVLDSVQTVGVGEADGSPGGVTQIREVTAALVRVAKRRGMTVIIIGHVTKDGAIAGPRLLEHLVDVVLAFEGERHSGFRMVRATKNRFGPADEVGCFEMTDAGIVEIPDPSGLFLSSTAQPVAGTCVSVSMEGRRPLLAEVQALVAPSPLQSPRRTTSGLERDRVALILAVLERKVRIALWQKDVYASTVGGARLSDPAADLAIAVAVASAALERNFPARVIALGEVGLAGDLRRVSGLDRRLSEAARLGFTTALIPVSSGPVKPLAGLRVVEVGTVSEALAAMDLTRPQSSRADSGAHE